jgi:polyferredoxin
MKPLFNPQSTTKYMGRGLGNWLNFGWRLDYSILYLHTLILTKKMKRKKWELSKNYKKIGKIRYLPVLVDVSLFFQLSPVFCHIHKYVYFFYHKYFLSVINTWL